MKKSILGKSKQRFIIIVISVIARVAFGQALFQGLNFPTNARSWGMGAAASSLMDDGSGALYNPATLADVSSGWQINYTSFILDIYSSTGNIMLSAPFGGNFALTTHLLNYGSFKERDGRGEQTGEFTANDFDISVAYGKPISKRLNFGTSMTYARADISNLSADGLLGTIGAIYYDKESTLSIGASYHNFGVLFSGFQNEKEKLPATFILGISKKLAHLPMIISADLFKSDSEKLIFKVGGEFNFNDRYFLRWGTSTRRFDIQAQQTFTNFLAASSAGAGLKMNTMRLDLAFVSLGNAGTISSLSISQQL